MILFSQPEWNLKNRRTFYSMRQGDSSVQWRMASAAQAVFLSMWQDVHGFGILYLSVIAGVMKANVWALTKTPGIVTSIFGMWHATHALPVEPSL